MATSYDVTYQGDARFPERTKPFELHGFPFGFPVGEPVELTESFIRETFNRTDLKDFVTFLFDGPKAVWNLHLRAPRFTVAEHVEPDTEPDPSPDPDPEEALEAALEIVAPSKSKSKEKAS